MFHIFRVALAVPQGDQRIVMRPHRMHSIVISETDHNPAANIEPEVSHIDLLGLKGSSSPELSNSAALGAPHTHTHTNTLSLSRHH
jgi:hypothetical protein